MTFQSQKYLRVWVVIPDIPQTRAKHIHDLQCNKMRRQVPKALGEKHSRQTSDKDFILAHIP